MKYRLERLEEKEEKKPRLYVKGKSRLKHYSTIALAMASGLGVRDGHSRLINNLCPDGWRRPWRGSRWRLSSEGLGREFRRSIEG